MPEHEDSSFGSSGFNKPVPPPSARPPASSAPPPPVELAGDARWSLLLGGVSGAFGGAAMMFVAAEIARRSRLDVNIIGTFGHAARILGRDSFLVGLGVAVAIGGIVGMLFGALMCHTRRLVARLLAGVILAIALWTLVHAFVFMSFAPSSLGALPLGPLAAGAAVFGICVALVRPPVRRVVVADS